MWMWILMQYNYVIRRILFLGNLVSGYSGLVLLCFRFGVLIISIEETVIDNHHTRIYSQQNYPNRDCHQSSGVFRGGALVHVPTLWSNFFSPSEKIRKTWFGPLYVSTRSQRKFCLLYEILNTPATGSKHAYWLACSVRRMGIILTRKLGFVSVSSPGWTGRHTRWLAWRQLCFLDHTRSSFPAHFQVMTGIIPVPHWTSSNTIMYIFLVQMMSLE